MGRPENDDDRALDFLLGKASAPPRMDAALVSQIVAQARMLPQQRSSRLQPFAVGAALAASLAIGMWMGAMDIGTAALGLAETEEVLSINDLVSLGDAADLSEGEAL